MVRRALSGWSPQLPDGIRTPEGWARRLLYRMENGPAATTIRNAARKALSSSDTDVRVGAILFFPSVQDPEADRIVWEAAKNDAEGLLTVRSSQGLSLGMCVIESAAQSWAAGALTDPEARTFIPRQATTPGRGAAVVSAIASRDVSWLQENYPLVVRANPDCALSVIVELFNALAWSGLIIEDVVRAVIAILGVSRETLRADAPKVFFGAARTRVLDAIGEAPTN